VVGFQLDLISTLLVPTLFSNRVVFNIPTRFADVGVEGLSDVLKSILPVPKLFSK
jgi:hypothetical protein